jgi:hypothetical protein
MARTRKFASVQNLYKYDVLIEDRGPKSDYFKISQFDGYLYGGRNAFLIAGSSVLRPGTKILVEVLDKNGGTIFSAPVPDYIEGNSRLIQVEIYQDTPIGPGKIVVLGCAEKYLDGTPIPSDWKNEYNVRWIADVIISPLFENKTPIRFANPPRIVVEEKRYVTPLTASFSQSVTEPYDIRIAPKFFNVFNNGYLISVSGTGDADRYYTKHLGGKFTGSVQWNDSVTGPETVSIDLPITRIFNKFTAESNATLLYSNKNTLITDLYISQSGQYETILNKTKTIGVTSSLNIVYSEETREDIGPERSYAEVRIVDLATLSGEIDKVKLSYKALTDEGEFTALAEIPTAVSELLSVDIDGRIIETGRFRDIQPRDYWYSATMSLSRNELNPTIPSYYNSASFISKDDDNALQSCFFLLDAITGTPQVVDGDYIDGKAYFIGTREENPIRLFPRSEYTLAFEALVSRVSASITFDQDDYSLEVYLVPLSGSASRVLTTDPRGQLLGTLTPTATFERQNFETVNFNFFPQIIEEGDYGIRFVIYGGAWNIANVSMKVAEERFFSPDEITALVPNEFKNRDFVLYKAEFLDVDNNSTAITATSIPTYFDGVGYVKRSGDSMYGELDIFGLPMYQQQMFDNYTGLVTGGLITINTTNSASYDISAGYGYIIDNCTDVNNPTYTKIEWPTIPSITPISLRGVSPPAYPRTNIAISTDITSPSCSFVGDNFCIYEQADRFGVPDYRQSIVLGRLAHVNTPFIQRVLTLPLTATNRNLHWFELAFALGALNVTGNVYSAAGTNRTIQKSRGQTFRIGSNYQFNCKRPDVTEDPLQTPVTFAYRYRSATPNVFIEQPATTQITGSLYDNGSGTLQTVNNNQWTVQRIYFFGATNTTRIQYGQAVYNSFAGAVAGIQTEAFIPDPNLADDAILRAFLVVRGGATNLSNLADAEFIEASAGFGGGGSGGGGAATAETASYALVTEAVRILDGEPNPALNQYTGSFSGSSLIINQIGVGTTTPINPLDVSGVIGATRLSLSQTTGTSPISVSSTTLVTNLNADLLDGLNASDFYPATNPSGYTTNTGTVTSIATNNGITGGTITTTGTIGLTGQSLALHNLGTNGIITRTGIDTVVGRTITGTANQVTVTNGDGVSGNPTLSLPQSINTAASVQFGSFGVGTAASGVTGEIRATNEITAYFSDIRLKDIHGNIDNALTKVISLNGVYFTENEVAKRLGYNNTSRQVGVIAQEVQSILPEAVTVAPIDEQYLTVKYEKIVPLLIEAIKELKIEVNELRALLNK